MVFALAADAALENGLLDSIGYVGALVLDLEDQLIAKVCHRQAYPAILAGMLAGCFKGIVDQVAEHADQLFPGQVGWNIFHGAVRIYVQVQPHFPRPVVLAQQAAGNDRVGYGFQQQFQQGLVVADFASDQREGFVGCSYLDQAGNGVQLVGVFVGLAAQGVGVLLDAGKLLAAVKENPKSVKFAGGSARGGWDHLKVLIAAKADGAEKLPSVPYLLYNNGGEAMSQVVGGQVDAFTGDLSEATGFMKSGDLRVLAVLAEERLPGEFADLPTAKEQGIDAVGPNWRGFYMPKGAEEGAREYWVEALNTLYASDQWKKVMKSNGLIPFHPPAGEFEAFVQAQVKDIETLSREIGLLK